MTTHVLNIAVAGLSAAGLVLTILGLRVWLRFGDARSALLFFAFWGFLAQGALLTWGLFIRNSVEDLLVPVVALSGVSLILVYMTTLVRVRA